MNKDYEEFEITSIGNYYGHLNIKKDNDIYYWGIENWNGIHWEEISKSLYNTIKKHNKLK